MVVTGMDDQGEARLAAGAAELWLALPDAVKFDPALAHFRHLYEKEHGKLQQPADQMPLLPKHLPLSKSAPTLEDFSCKEEFGSSIRIDVFGTQKGCHANESNHAWIDQAKKWTKVTAMMGLWMFFTAVFVLYDEKVDSIRHALLSPGETQYFPLESAKHAANVLLTLEGPFLTENEELNALNKSSDIHSFLQVWVSSRSPGDENANVDISDKWSVMLSKQNVTNLFDGRKRQKLVTLKLANVTGHVHSHSIKVETNSTKTMAISMSYVVNPVSELTGILCSCVLLLGLYAFIIFEVINRTLAAVLMSTCALAVLSMVGERPSLADLVSWLDVETLLLLFSMMVLVAIAAETGIFDYLAVFAFKVTKGRIWPLINLLCAITAGVSIFLDNVTTILLMTPVTIRLCEVMSLNPKPILMALVVFSNVGGTATAVGDPPNVIVSSNADVINHGINFINFTLHMSAGVLLVFIQTHVQFRLTYRNLSSLRQSEPKDIKDLRQQIVTWKRAANNLGNFTVDEAAVKAALEDQVRSLSHELDAKLKERRKRAVPKETFHKTLEGLQSKYKIRDEALLIKATVAIIFVIIMFFMHAIPDLERVSLAWTALLGAIMLLILYDKEDLEPILHRVEWSTLLFFAALFVFVEAITKLGLIGFIGDMTEKVILSVSEESRLSVAIILIIWVSGITSAFVDNIPLATMMVRVVTSLGSRESLHLPMQPLVWALCFGVCLGGNGTIVGASANVVCAGVAEHHGYKISFLEFFKFGFPLMLGHLATASVYLLIAHCVFHWH